MRRCAGLIDPACWLGRIARRIQEAGGLDICINEYLVGLVLQKVNLRLLGTCLEAREGLDGGNARWAAENLMGAAALAVRRTPSGGAANAWQATSCGGI